MRTLVLLAGVLLAAGSATSYQPMGLSGGYEDQRVSQDRFFIHVKGNRYTDSGTVVGYFHRRAQECCSSVGFMQYEIETLGNDARVAYHVMGNSVVQSSKPEVYGTVRCFGYQPRVVYQQQPH